MRSTQDPARIKPSAVLCEGRFKVRDLHLLPSCTAKRPCEGSALMLLLPAGPGVSPSVSETANEQRREYCFPGGHRLVRLGQENGTSHLCVYALSSHGLMTSMREESIPSRAISESRQNRETRCSRWVPDFCQRWRQERGEIDQQPF